MNTTRAYKGHEIVRRDNAQMGCPGNRHPGMTTYYEVYKDGEFKFATGTLREAREVLDYEPTANDRAKFAQLRESLLGE